MVGGSGDPVLHASPNEAVMGQCYRVILPKRMMRLGQARRKKTTPSWVNKIVPYLLRAVQEMGFLAFCGVALYLGLALVSFRADDPAWTHTSPAGEVANLGGVLGARLADILLYFFGYLAYLLPIGVAFCGWTLFRRGRVSSLDAEIVMFRMLGFLIVLTAGSGLASLHLSNSNGYLTASAGGIIGSITGPGLITAFGLPTGNLFLFALFLASITLATGLSWLGLLDLLGKSSLGLWAGMTKLAMWVRSELAASRSVTEDDGEPNKAVEASKDLHKVSDQKLETLDMQSAHKRNSSRVEPVLRLSGVIENGLAEEPPAFSSASSPKIRKAGRAEADRSDSHKHRPVVTESGSAAILPTLDLLTTASPDSTGGYSSETLEEMSRHLEVLLKHYGIDVRVVAVEPGPVITCFELELAPGVKVSQISGLAKDLARGLSVFSVRVVEIIPGKSVIGLEIPNQHREFIYLSEILSSGVYVNSPFPTTLALGKDISGKPVVANLAKMPHLLVAGTTGSGKSVAINAMLLSILYKAGPEEVRLILVDPKMLELSVYEGIPHLLTPVVTDMKEAANALRWCVGEMERRYKLMAAMQVRNITGFNRMISDAAAVGQPILDPLYKPDLADSQVPPLKPLPIIVVVIDELADMMMLVGKKVEELIARLAQKARAAGIHLILATQRPSVDVITGLIKANIPTRIAFQVSSRVDSRTILDQMGAEQLLGSGDMLYLPPGTGFPRRLHGAFVDDQEVGRVVEFLRKNSAPDYIEGILEGSVDGSNGLGGYDAGDEGGEGDPLYDEAVRIVTESRRASISGVQRRLKIGYNRAARMIEEMESAGIVGPSQTNGSREVLAPPPPEF